MGKRFRLPFQQRSKLREQITQRKDASVVNHDKIDEFVHGRLKEDSPRFKKISEAKPDIQVRDDDGRIKRVEQYQAMPDLTTDLFYSHISTAKEVTTKPASEVLPSSKFHAEIMQHYVVQEDYLKARTRTMGDDFTAAVTTMAAQHRMEEEVATYLAHAPDPNEASNLQDEVSKQQSIIDGLRALAQAGVELTAEQRDAMRDAARARRDAEDALSQVQAPSNGAQIAQAAASEARDTANTLSNLPGCGVGETRNMSPDQALKLLNQIKEAPNIKALLKFVGRLERDFRYARSKRVVEGREMVVGVTNGDDPDFILPDEFALLADPVTSLEFYRRYAQRGLLQFETAGEESAGSGPLIILRDVSGSMQSDAGEGMDCFTWAGAVAISMIQVAQRERRACYLIDYHSHVAAEYDFPAKMTAEQIIQIATWGESGGTNAAAALDRAMEHMRTATKFKQADVVMLTDGEDYYDRCKPYADEMKSMGVRLHGVGIGIPVGPESFLARLAEDTEGTACAVSDMVNDRDGVRNIVTSMA